MGYKIVPGERVDAGVSRIAAEQLDKALGELDTWDDGDALVHALRRRCKRLRALLRLVRSGLGARYAEENRALRDLSRILASFRDGRVVLATHDGLVDRFGDVLDAAALTRVRAQLEQSRTARDTGEPETLARRLVQCREHVASARERVAAWNVTDGGDALGAGLERTYKLARRAYKRAAASSDVGEFHEWRKLVKYHWYHAQLTAPLFGRSLKRRARESEKLSDELGDAHDLAVYEARLERIAGSEDASAVDVLRALSLWRREGLHERALELGRALFAEKPKHFAASLKAHRDASHARH